MSIINKIKAFLELLNLQTFKSKIFLFATASILIYIVPFKWLENLSLFKFLGWQKAPSIGLTRAYWLLIHGKIKEAWQQNWLIYPILTLWLIIMLFDYLSLRTSKKRPKSPLV